MLLDAYLVRLDSWSLQWLDKWKPLHLKGRNNLEKSRKLHLWDFQGGMTPLHVFILLNVQHLYVRKMQWGTEEYKMRYKVLWLYVIWFMWHFLFSIRSPFCCCIHFLLYCFVFNVLGVLFVRWWVCLFVSCDIQCINLCLVLTLLELDILLTPPPILNCANFCVGFFMT